MASRNIEKLVPEFRDKLKVLISKLPFEVLFYCTGRSCQEQAKLWRQSRQIETIKKKAAVLEKYGHENLAKILIDVGPQHGPHVTHAGPGESWHNYWQAADCVPVVGGKLLWDVSRSKAYWDEIGKQALALELNWGGNWPKWADYPHIQFPPTGNPLKLGIPNPILLESDL